MNGAIKMETRSYKNTEEKISLLGFGCMRFPKRNRITQRIDRALAQEMIDLAHSNGVNYYDTAYIYHLGDSEAFMGEALKKYPRESFYLASKLPTWLIRKESDVEKYLDKQLKKCCVEYFDYYLVHCITAGNAAKLEKYNIYEILKKKQAEGKIRKLGFSFHDKPPLLEKVVDKYQWDFVQIQLNYMDWDLQDARTQYKILTDRNIPVIVMEPVRGGALATLNAKSAELLKNADPSASAASWALRYAASLPKVLTVLSGMSTLDQVKDNIKTFSDFKPLSPDDYRLIEKVLATYKLSSAIPCTSCNYCMPCPKGVDIPKNFAIYNICRASSDNYAFSMDYGAMDDSQKAKSCVKCKKCESHCPQSIEITKHLAEISAFAETAGKE